VVNGGQPQVEAADQLAAQLQHDLPPHQRPSWAGAISTSSACVGGVLCANRRSTSNQVDLDKPSSWHRLQLEVGK
jgi:hypothetical protein